MTARPPQQDAVARRNLLVTVAMVFAVFTGFAFVLPFLPLFVRDLGVAEPDAAALWAGVLIGIASLVKYQAILWVPAIMAAIAVARTRSVLSVLFRTIVVGTAGLLIPVAAAVTAPVVARTTSL